MKIRLDPRLNDYILQKSMIYKCILERVKKRKIKKMAFAIWAFKFSVGGWRRRWAGRREFSGSLRDI